MHLFLTSSITCRIRSTRSTPVTPAFEFDKCMSNCCLISERVATRYLVLLVLSGDKHSVASFAPRSPPLTTDLRKFNREKILRCNGALSTLSHALFFSGGLY